MILQANNKWYHSTITRTEFSSFRCCLGLCLGASGYLLAIWEEEVDRLAEAMIEWAREQMEAEGKRGSAGIPAEGRLLLQSKL